MDRPKNNAPRNRGSVSYEENKSHRSGFPLRFVFGTLLFLVLLLQYRLTWMYGGVFALDRMLLHILAFLSGIFLLCMPSTGFRIFRPLSGWIAFTLFCVFVLFSTIPLSKSMINKLAPFNSSIWERVEDIPVQEVQDVLQDTPLSPSQGFLSAKELRPHFSVSVHPNETYRLFLDIISYSLIMLTISFLVYREKWALSAFMYGLIPLIVFEAGYGLVSFWTGFRVLPLLVNPMQTGASGTFYNRNHYVDFMGMVFPFAWVFLYSLWRKIRFYLPNSLRLRILYILNYRNGSFLLLFLFGLIIFLAIVFSLSRGGIIATLFLFLLAPLLFRRLVPSTQQNTRKRSRAFVSALMLFILISILVVLWVGPEPVLERFAQTESELELHQNRLEAFYDGVLLWLESPIVGTGLGTFGDVFYRFQTFYSTLWWNHLHNEYLQLLIETGTSGMVLFAIAFSAWVLWVGKARYKRRFAYYFRFAGLMSLFYLLFDSFYDFNFHIPANALLFVIIMGAITGVTLREIENNNPEFEKSNLERTSHRIVFIGILIIPLLFLGYGILRRDPVFRLEDQVRVHKEYAPPLNKSELEHIVRYLSKRRPTANLYQYLGIRYARDQQDYGKALEFFLRASILNPSDYISRMNIAEILWRKDISFRLADEFFQKAIEIAPTQAEVWFESGLFHWTLANVNRAVHAFSYATYLNLQYLPEVYQRIRRLRNVKFLRRVTPPGAELRLAQEFIKLQLYDEARPILMHFVESKDESVFAKVFSLALRYQLDDVLERVLERVENEDNYSINVRLLQVRYYLKQKLSVTAESFVQKTYHELWTVDQEKALEFAVKASQIFVSYGKMTPAKYFLQRVLDQYPYLQEARLVSARIALREHLPYKALEHTSFTNQYPTTCQIILDIGRFFFQKNDVRGLKRAVEMMEEKWSCRPYLLPLRIELALRTGDHQRVREYYLEFTQNKSEERLEPRIHSAMGALVPYVILEMPDSLDMIGRLENPTLYFFRGLNGTIARIREKETVCKKLATVFHHSISAISQCNRWLQ